jgi:hypothetical protein
LRFTSLSFKLDSEAQPLEEVKRHGQFVLALSCPRHSREPFFAYLPATSAGGSFGFVVAIAIADKSGSA